MLDIPSFTTETLKDLPFTSKAVEQLEQEAIMKGEFEDKIDSIKSVISMRFGVLPEKLKKYVIPNKRHRDTKCYI